VWQQAGTEAILGLIGDDLMATKERLHQLIDELPEGDLPAVERVLDDPLVRALLVTPEGEPPLTAEEIAGILESRRDKAEGRTRRFSNVEDAVRWLEEGETPAKA
jgi:hypothetical protein